MRTGGREREGSVCPVLARGGPVPRLAQPVSWRCLRALRGGPAGAGQGRVFGRGLSDCLDSSSRLSFTSFLSFFLFTFFPFFLFLLFTFQGRWAFMGLGGPNLMVVRGKNGLSSSCSLTRFCQTFDRKYVLPLQINTGCHLEVILLNI